MPAESSASGALVEVEIDALGAGGDGIAETPQGALYIAYTVPGDLVRVRIGAKRGEGRAASVVERLRDGPQRAPPRCRHFGACGGCALQHLSASAYRAWLHARVAAPLGRRGLDAGIVGEPFVVAPGTRRRARFALRRRRGRLAMAFKERGGSRLVPIEECPVLRPSIVDALPALAEALAPVLAEAGPSELAVADTDTGLDLLVLAPERASAGQRAALSQAAAAVDAARLCWQAEGPPEPAALRRPVQVSFSGVAVDLPPGAFLQPTAKGEEVLVAAAWEALAGARRVADLYAGCGPFSFALARLGALVVACESDGEMARALDAAARRAGLGAQIRAEARDLERRPLLGRELAGLDGVVLDPPRAGAETQVRALAESGVPTVVYASCNPASFARDARILADGGYRLESVTPLGQFLWSAEVELAAVLRR